jgi:hypothetical protein
MGSHRWRPPADTRSPARMPPGAPDPGDPWYRALARVIKLSGLYGRGRRNAHAIVGRTLAWRVPGLPEGLRGYTSSGAGGCGLPLRFNTRSEVATLVLERA